MYPPAGEMMSTNGAVASSVKLTHALEYEPVRSKDLTTTLCTPSVRPVKVCSVPIDLVDQAPPSIWYW